MLGIRTLSDIIDRDAEHIPLGYTLDHDRIFDYIKVWRHGTVVKIITARDIADGSDGSIRHLLTDLA